MLGSKIRTSALVLSIVALAACESSVAQEDGNGGGGNDGDSTTTSPPDGPSTTGTGLLCEEYADQAATTSVNIHVVNHSGQDVFIPSLCSSPSYQITGSDADPTQYGSVGGFCLQTCEDLQTEGRIACDACAPSSHRLKSGDTLDLVWDGRGLAQASMPSKCFFEPGSGTDCSLFRVAPAGDYQLLVRGFSSCGEAGEACACTNDGDCQGDASGGEAFPNPTTISYPSENNVEVLFDVCAFGCAEPFH